MSLTREMLEQIRRQGLRRWCDTVGEPERDALDILCDMALRSLDREGWVSVPKEPTDILLWRMGLTRLCFQSTIMENDALVPILGSLDARAVYANLIAAAPGDTKP